MREKVIVITGASSGIGAELARQLGRQGHRLVLGARRRMELRAVAGEIEGEVVTVPADVSLRINVERLRDEALKAFGHVDVWVNNAGRGINRSVLELSDEDVDDILAINLKSVLYGIQAIVPHFIERGTGHLINVSSFLGRVPLASHRSIYSAAKAAVNSLTTNLRTDLAAAHPDIHVSLVMPGVVTTDFARNVRGATPQGPVPVSTMPFQSPEEVAAQMVELIAHPVPELYTNPASLPIVRRFYEDAGSFEGITRSS